MEEIQLPKRIGRKEVEEAKDYLRRNAGFDTDGFFAELDTKQRFVEELIERYRSRFPMEQVAEINAGKTHYVICSLPYADYLDERLKDGVVISHDL